MSPIFFPLPEQLFELAVCRRNLASVPYGRNLLRTSFSLCDPLKLRAGFVLHALRVPPGGTSNTSRARAGGLLVTPRGARALRGLLAPPSCRHSAVRVLLNFLCGLNEDRNARVFFPPVCLREKQKRADLRGQAHVSSPPLLFLLN